MPTLTCSGCGKKVEMKKYESKNAYNCAKCRGIEIPKKSSKRVVSAEPELKGHYSAMRYGG
jgi:endogenous inhibitor of DNA gyrase (YacG/DUF329 family)